MLSNSIHKRLFSGAVWAVTARVSAGLLVFVIDIMLTRNLSVTDAGVYFLAFSLISILTVFSQLGMNISLVKSISSNLTTNSLRLIQSQVASSFLIALTILVTIYLFMQSKLFHLGLEKINASNQLDEFSTWIWLWLFSSTFLSLISEVFRGLHRIGWASVFSGFCRNLMIVVTLLLFTSFTNALNLKSLFVIVSCATTLTLCFAIVSLRKTSPFDKSLSTNIDVTSVFHASLPFFLYCISQVVFRESHLWLVSTFLSSENIAKFAVIMKLSLVLGMPIALISGTIQSTISELYTKQEFHKLQRLMSVISTFQVLGMSLILGVVFIYSEEIIRLIFGEKYISSAFGLKILIIGQAINVITGLPGILLMMTGYGKLTSLISVVTGVLGLAISLILIPQFGINGAAISVTLVLCLQNIAFCYFAHNKLDISTQFNIKKTFINVKYLANSFKV